MSNWFKKSWNVGVPLSEDYSRGITPPQAKYKNDPRGIVTPSPQFGGKERDGYPKGYSRYESSEADFEHDSYSHLSGGDPLINDKLPMGHGPGKEYFTHPIDKAPKQLSKKLDNISVGPFNMQMGGFNRAKRKTRFPELRI